MVSNIPVTGYYIYTEAATSQQKTIKPPSPSQRSPLPKIPILELKCLHMYHTYGNSNDSLIEYGHRLWHKQSIWSRTGIAH